MRKKVGIVKRLFTLLLVFLLSINSFAAIVSDNDGSAFITKAEFDALKSSFQSQIDTYNQSIDSKIDGAIASYLAGIHLSRQIEMDVLCYTPDGILAPRGLTDTPWTEGKLEFTGASQWYYWKEGGANVGGIQFASDIKSVSGTNFKELMVSDVDYTNKTANWQGYSETKQRIAGFGASGQWSSNASVPGSTYYLTNFTYKSFSNVDMSSIRITDWSNNPSDFLFNFRGHPSTKGSTSYWNIIMPAFSQMSREIGTTQFADVISVPANNTCKRFSNKDQIRDWMNDSDKTGHTKNFKISDWITQFDCIVWILRDNVSGKTKYTPTTEISTSESSSNMMPYFGFTNLEYWDCLYTTKYDGYLSDMRGAQSDLYTITDKNSKKHLGIGAGAPIAKIKKDCEVELPINFQDTTQNYDIWLKIGSFTKGNSPDSESDLIKSASIPGTTNGSMTNSIKVTNGHADLKFKMPKDGYLFLKWSFYGNSQAGGGVYMPTQVIKCMQPD